MVGALLLCGGQGSGARGRVPVLSAGLWVSSEPVSLLLYPLLSYLLRTRRALKVLDAA